MDEKTINAKACEPINVLPELARLHRLGVNVFFAFGPEPDPSDATKYIADADQGGLGMRDRDYYLMDDENSVETRNQYLKHISAPPLRTPKQ